MLATWFDDDDFQTLQITNEHLTLKLTTTAYLLYMILPKRT